MAVINPFNLKAWIDEHRHLLKPPVGNKQVYQDSDFIVMVVGGPNDRKDFHVNPTEEFFYQVEGDAVVRIVEDGKIRDVTIKEGEIWLLPANVPHSPQRKANTVGLVIERQRETVDFLQWYCENCHQKLWEASFHMKDITTQMQPVFEKFYADEHLRTCKHCQSVMVPPAMYLKK